MTMFDRMFLAYSIIFGIFLWLGIWAAFLYDLRWETIEYSGISRYRVRYFLDLIVSFILSIFSLVPWALITLLVALWVYN